MTFYPIFWFGAACADLSDLEEQLELPSQEWCADSRNATVDSVYDGDTAVLFGDFEKIRLLGVAAPEVANSESPSECYGNESRDYLDRLISNEAVRLEFDVECKDIYDRTLAWIILEGDDSFVASEMSAYGMTGLNEEDGSYTLVVNELLIRAGYATVFDGDVAQNIRYSERLEQAEDDAESTGLGLWSACP